jgi:hypothetical protein
MKLLSMVSRPLVPFPKTSACSSMGGRLVEDGTVNRGIGRGVGFAVGLGVTLIKQRPNVGHEVELARVTRPINRRLAISRH